MAIAPLEPSPEEARTMEVVGREVARILESSPAFWSLPEEKREDLRRDTYKVANFIAGGSTGVTPHSVVLAGSPASSEAEALAGPARVGQASQARHAGGITASDRFTPAARKAG